MLAVKVEWGLRNLGAALRPVRNIETAERVIYIDRVWTQLQVDTLTESRTTTDVVRQHSFGEKV